MCKTVFAKACLTRAAVVVTLATATAALKTLTAAAMAVAMRNPC